MASEALGVTTQKLNDMLENGEVLAEELLPKLADVLENRFGKAALDSAESAQASFNRLTNTITELQRGVGESGLTDNMKDLADSAREFLEVNQELIVGELSFFFNSVTKAAEGTLNKLDQIASVLRFIGKFGDVMAGVIEGPTDPITVAADNIERLNFELVALQNSRSFAKNAEEAKKIDTEIQSVEDSIKRWKSTLNSVKSIANNIVVDLSKIPKLVKPADLEYSPGNLEEAYKLQQDYEKATEFLRKQRQSKIEKEREKDLKDLNDMYAKQLAAANLHWTTEGKLYKELLDQRTKDRQAINDKYDKEIQDQLDKEAKAIQKAYEKRKKVIDKALKEEFDDIDNFQKEVIKGQEKFQKNYQKTLLSDLDYKLWLLDQEKAYWETVEQDKDKISEWYTAKRQSIYKEAADKEAKIQQKSYDEIYGYAKDFSDDIIDNWDNMGDALVDMAQNMVKDIASAFLTKNIVMPVMLSMGGQMGMMTKNGVPYSSFNYSADGSNSILQPLSMLKTGYNAFTGGISNSVGNFLGSGMPNQIGSSIFGGLWGSAGTAAGSTIGTGLSGSGVMASVNTASTASTGIVGALSAAAPYLAIATMALPMITSLFESEPEPRIGIRKGEISEYGYNPTTKDMSNQGPINKYIVEYYDAYFAAIDELTANSVKDVLSNTDWERLRVHPEDFDSVEDALFAVNDTIFKKFADGFISGLAGGKLTEYLDVEFFEDIKLENESLLDSFIRFGSALEESDDFLNQFTRQIDEFGETTEDAFTNTSTIISTMDEIESSLEGITQVSSVATLNTLTESWEALIDTLKEANATTEDLGSAESAFLQSIGANITGLTADNLQSTLMNEESLESILKSSAISAGYAKIAQVIVDKYIVNMNEEIGKAWTESDGDLTVVMEAIRDLDTTEAQREIDALQESFKLIEESAGKTSDEVDNAVAKATRSVTLALTGQISAAQQFQEWQIDNAEALSLYSDITSNNVTKKELQGAVEAFEELGIEGDQLNSIIDDLADRFSSAADDLVASISNVASAQDNLVTAFEGELTTTETLESLQTFFRDIPSWSTIVGSTTTTRQVEIEPTDADYEDLINDIFQELFGRDAASAGLEYWSDALKNATDGINYDNIMQSILDGAEAAFKGGNLKAGKDIAYYLAASPTVGPVDPIESTYEDKTFTTMNDISSELEADIYDTIDALEALPALVTNGVVNDSNIAEWVNVISNANKEALSKIFGDDSETMINSLAGAIDDYNAITETASNSTNSLTKAIDNTQDLMDEYISYLEIEIDTRQTALEDATNVLQEYIENEQALIDARKEAVENIEDFIDGLYGSTSAPVQSMEYFQTKYSELLAEAKTSGPDDVTESVSNLTSFVNDYLDFASAYDDDNYADLFSTVVDDLADVADLQSVFAEAQANDLKEVEELIGYSNEELIDINEAIQELKEAELAVNDVDWMNAELEKLGAIDDNISLLLTAQLAYYDKIGEDVPDDARFFATGDNILQGTIDELGIDLNNLLFSTISSRLQGLIEKGTYSDLAASMIMNSSSTQIAASGLDISELLSVVGDVSSDYQFAGGGVISGPMSGYTMPYAEFHGTEAIIPLADGAVPVVVQTPTQSNQNVQVKVYIDGKELNNVIVKTIKTDPEAQGQIRRVVNG